MGQVKNSTILVPRGEPLAKCWSADLERPNPPTHTYEHRGGAGTCLGARNPPAIQDKIHILENREEPLAKFWWQGLERPNTPTHAYRHRSGGSDIIVGPEGTATGPEKFQNLAHRGEPLAKFWLPGTGGGGHMPPPPPPPYPPRRPPSPPPRTPGFQTGEWLPQGEGRQHARSAPATSLAALGLSDSSIHTFAVARGLPSCHRIFGGRSHFSASLPLLTFVKNVSLLNPYLNPACKGGGVHSLADSSRIG